MNVFRAIGDIFKQLSYVLTKGQKRMSIPIFFMIVIGSFFEMLGVSAILPFIESLTSPDDIMNKWYTIWLVQIFNLDNYISIVIGLAICIVVIYIIKNVYLYLSQILQTLYRSKVQKKMSVKMFRTYLEQSYEDYVNMNTAQMIRGIGEDVSGVYNIMDYIFRIFGETFTVTLISIYLIYTDFIMALAIILIALSCLMIIVLGLKKKMTALGISSREIRTARNNSAYQAISGFKEIKVARKTNNFVKKYENEYEYQRKIEMQNEMITNIPERLIETLCVAALIVSVCIRMKMGTDISAFIAKLAVFAVAAFRLLPSVSRLTRYFNGIIYSRPSLRGIYDQLSYLEMRPNRTRDVEEKKEVLKFEDKIELQKVSWKYRDSDKIILDNVDLSINKGDAVAIIGPSGAGKSTLADILLGLLKPIHGDLFLDGRNIYENLDGWSKLIGFVPQNIYMLDGTIKDNIIFGENAENVADEKIWEVLQRVSMKEYVENLPEKLLTKVGERGMKISGGQKQRIAIARALYKDPDILILDEATSALDNDTEKAVMESIDSLQGEKTLIIIAHRISTIKNCNKIFEINKGHICPKKYEDIV